MGDWRVLWVSSQAHIGVSIKLGVRFVRVPMKRTWEKAGTSNGRDACLGALEIDKAGGDFEKVWGSVLGV